MYSNFPIKTFEMVCIWYYRLTQFLQSSLTGLFDWYINIWIDFFSFEFYFMFEWYFPPTDFYSIRSQRSLRMFLVYLNLHTLLLIMEMCSTHKAKNLVASNYTLYTYRDNFHVFASMLDSTEKLVWFGIHLGRL